MSNVEQFEKAVAGAGAVAMRVVRGPRGSERLLIQTPGGLITRGVTLRGDLSEDIQAATISAMEIVAGASGLTSPSARSLSSRPTSEWSAEAPAPIANRSTRRAESSAIAWPALYHGTLPLRTPRDADHGGKGGSHSAPKVAKQ